MNSGMTYIKLLDCLESTKLSPEDLAPYFSVSNMTLRRWEGKKDQKIPAGEMEMIINGIFSLIADGYLPMESPEVQNFVENNFRSTSYFNSVMKTLGLSKSVKSQAAFEDSIVESLNTIGSKSQKQSYVESQLKTLPAYLKKVGKELASRTMTLVEVIKSTEMSKKQKLVAYGALFYLFLPFDLIPDSIPVFGYLDDFAVLGFAVAYYQSLENKKTKLKTT